MGSLGGELEDKRAKEGRHKCPVAGKTQIVQWDSTHSFVPVEHFCSLKDESTIEICSYFLATPNYTVELGIPENWNFLLTSERLILMRPSCMVRLLALTDAVKEENLSLCKVSVQFLHYFL